MKEFTAVLLTFSSGEDKRDLYQEIFILINANNELEARKLAEEWGKSQEQQFISVEKSEVSWKFKKIVDVYETIDEKSVQPIREVYSRFFSNIETYEEWLSKAIPE